jgi:hypothetical protein
LIRGLIARDVDVGSARIVRDPETRGFGHAYGFIVDRLFRGRSIPMIPLLLNTYFPPGAHWARASVVMRRDHVGYRAPDLLPLPGVGT